ncbi:MAG: hypothetical protein GX946_10405 [Oligosphaeraceae bacterium]|nr:hypothetical protein [Oligosphaeraceae bacterium]
MIRSLFFLLVMLGCGSLSALELRLPIHAGRLDTMDRALDARSFINREKAIQGKMFEPNPDNESLYESLEPGPEQAFIIFKVAVLPGRSISRFDYELVIDGRAYACQSMALANQSVFDFRLLEVQGPQEVMLLYTVPEKATSASLRSAYTQLPMPTISGLRLQPEETPAPVELEKVEEESSTEEGAAAEKGEEKPSENETPEAKKD